VKHLCFWIDGQTRKVLFQASETHEIPAKEFHLLQQLGATLFKHRVQGCQIEGAKVFLSCRDVSSEFLEVDCAI